MGNCRQANVTIQKVVVQKSESYSFGGLGLGGEPGASAEWELHFTVGGNSDVIRFDDVRDGSVLTVNRSYLVDLGPLESLRVEVSGVEVDDTSADDPLPLASTIITPATNWAEGQTFDVSASSSPDFVYKFTFDIRCASTSQALAVAPNPHAAAMQRFRFVAEIASRQGFPGAFPNFYEATQHINHVGGTIFVSPAVAEWRDVPLAELGNPPLENFGERMRAVNAYASRNGFVGGFPNFFHADYRDGRGIVCGTVLLRRGGAEWRDVPLADLGNPPLDNIEARFRATHDYAVRNGFIGGFPNLFHAEKPLFAAQMFDPADARAVESLRPALLRPFRPGILRPELPGGVTPALPGLLGPAKQTVCGTILLKPGFAEWRDVLLFRDPA